MLLGQQPQRALSSQFNSQFSFYKNRSQISHQSPVSAVTFFIESTPSLSTSSQIDLYDQRPSQTRRYPPSVSSSPQKDMQPKVRVQLSILALTIQILCLLSTSILFSLYGIWTVVTWDKLLDEVFSKSPAFFNLLSMACFHRNLWAHLHCWFYRMASVQCKHRNLWKVSTVFLKLC